MQCLSSGYDFPWGILSEFSGMILGFRSFSYQIHELVEIGSDDNLGAAVHLTAYGGVVGGYGVIFAAAAYGHARGVNPETVLEHLHNR